MPQDIQVSLVRQEHLDEMEPLAQWACPGLKATLEPQAQVPQVNQARMAPLVCLDPLGQKVHKVQLDSPVLLECQELVKLESPESPAAEEPLVLLEPQDKRESLVPLVLLVTQVVQVPSAQLAHKVLEDSKVKQAQ